MIATRYYLTCGIGVAEKELAAFDCSLIDAHVGDFNHVKVSSVLPEKCKRKDCVQLEKGSIVHTAYANLVSNQENVVLSACVAVGIPQREGCIGMIMEYSGTCSVNEAEQIAIDLVKDAMGQRNIEIREILTAPISAKVPSGCYLSVFSALVMW